MEQENIFPNWFRYLLFFIAFWSLAHEFGRSVEVNSNFIIVLALPILLLLILIAVNKRVMSVGSGKYFFNITICIMFFFSLIFFSQYRTYIEHIGRFIGGNFKIGTDYANTDYDEYGRPYAPDKVVQKDGESSFYPYASHAIFFALMAYFILSSWYLSKKVKLQTKKIKEEEQKKIQDMLKNFPSEE